MKNILSRRNFLRGAGGAVSLSWGGLRIFAGPAECRGRGRVHNALSIFPALHLRNDILPSAQSSRLDAAGNAEGHRAEIPIQYRAHLSRRGFITIPRLTVSFSTTWKKS